MRLTFISKSRRLGSKLIFQVKGDSNSSSTISTNSSSCPDSFVRKIQTVSVSNSCSTLTNDAADDDRRLIQVFSTANSVSTKVDHNPMTPKAQALHSPSSSGSPLNAASSCQSALNNDSAQSLDPGFSSSSSRNSKNADSISASLNQLPRNHNFLEEKSSAEFENKASKEVVKPKSSSFRHSMTSTSKRIAQLYRQKKNQLKSLHAKLKQSVTHSSASSSSSSITGSNTIPIAAPVELSTDTQFLSSLPLKKSSLLLKNKRLFEEDSLAPVHEAEKMHCKRVRLDRTLDLPLDAPCTPLQQILSKPKEKLSLEYLWADRPRRLQSARSIESSVVSAEVSAGIPRFALGQSLLSTADEALFPPTPLRSPAFNHASNNNNDDRLLNQDRFPALPSLTNSMHAMSMFTLMCQNSVSNTGTELCAVGDLGSPFHEP